MRVSRLWVAVVALGLLVPSCGGDNGTGPSGPEVSGCSAVMYQGVSFPISACSQGASSAQVSGTVNGVNACFNVTCSGGCVSSVSLCGS